MVRKEQARMDVVKEARLDVAVVNEAAPREARGNGPSASPMNADVLDVARAQARPGGDATRRYLSQRPCSSRDGRTHSRAAGTLSPSTRSSTPPSSSSWYTCTRSARSATERQSRPAASAPPPPPLGARPGGANKRRQQRRDRTVVGAAADDELFDVGRQVRVVGDADGRVFDHTAQPFEVRHDAAANRFFVGGAVGCQAALHCSSRVRRSGRRAFP